MAFFVPCGRLLQRAYLEFTLRTRNLVKLTQNGDKCLQELQFTHSTANIFFLLVEVKILSQHPLVIRSIALLSGGISLGVAHICPRSGHMDINYLIENSCSEGCHDQWRLPWQRYVSWS